MEEQDETAARRRRGRRRRAVGAALGAAISLPVLAHAVIRRRARAPEAPRWGRARHFAGRHGAISFQELGDGPPLVLLHSFGPGYDVSQWQAAAEELAPRHRIYAPDLPGWGRSAGAALEPALYVEAIAEFIAGVVREPAAVAAAGLPASYAAHVAARHPEWVQALALVAPLGITSGPWEGLAGAATDTLSGPLARQVLRELLRLPLLRVTVLDLLTSRSALERHLRHHVYAVPERVDAAVLEHHYRASHLPACRSALAAYLRGDLWLPAAEVLPRLAAPVWIAWGRCGFHPPVENADLWLRALPGARLEVFERSGDLPHTEVPAHFGRALTHFLGELAASGH
jgi:pimeloyl-ACP methyl ester carboxylesterase